MKNKLLSISLTGVNWKNYKDMLPSIALRNAEHICETLTDQQCRDMAKIIVGHALTGLLCENLPFIKPTAYGSGVGAIVSTVMAAGGLDLSSMFHVSGPSQK